MPDPVRVAYLGQSRWVVEGRHGDWSLSYARLVRKHGLHPSRASDLMMRAVELDRRPAPGLNPPTR